MKARLTVSCFVVLACASALAAQDTCSMTYESTTTSRPATIQLISFAIARAVDPPASGRPTSGAQKRPAGVTNSGQITVDRAKHPREFSNTFKKGAQFAKITIVLSGLTPAGAIAPMRRWVLTGVGIDSYAVTGTGPSAQAIINLHWKSIALSTP